MIIVVVSMATMKVITKREEDAAALSVFQDTCHICKRRQARYACPRCGVRYCCLDCYKSEEHLECSETFYRDNVLGELQSQHASDEEKLKMLDILKHQIQERANEDDNEASEKEDEEEGVESLVKRFADVEIDMASAETILSKLTAKEKAEFERVLQSSSAGELVEMWTAWWDLPEAGDTSEISPAESSNLPSVPDVTPFSSLCKARPSDDLPCNLVNILFAYCLSARLFNGDHHILPSEAAECALAVSSCLSCNSTYSTVESGVRHAIASAQQSSSVAVPLSYCVAVVHDIHTLLKAATCPVFPVSYTPPPWRALADLHRILDTAYRLDQETSKHATKPSSGSSGVCQDDANTSTQVPIMNKTARKQLLNAQRKVYFFLSWAKTLTAEWSLLMESVQLQHECLLDELNKLADAKKGIETQRTKPSCHPQLVQELP